MRSISAYCWEPGSKSQYAGHHWAMKKGVENYQSSNSCLIWIQDGCLGVHGLPLWSTSPRINIYRYFRLCLTNPYKPYVAMRSHSTIQSLPHCWWTLKYNYYNTTDESLKTFATKLLMKRFNATATVTLLTLEISVTTPLMIAWGHLHGITD